jgi:hypothetical protein
MEAIPEHERSRLVRQCISVLSSKDYQYRCGLIKYDGADRESVSRIVSDQLWTIHSVNYDMNNLVGDVLRTMIGCDSQYRLIETAQAVVFETERGEIFYGLRNTNPSSSNTVIVNMKCLQMAVTSERIVEKATNSGNGMSYFWGTALFMAGLALGYAAGYIDATVEVVKQSRAA